MELDVAQGPIESLPPEQRFDAVTLWHSLEHMREPRRVLEWVRGALAPGGVAERIGDGLFFPLCDASRLAFYALYLAVARLRGRRADSSELLVIARPRSQ
jgi:hypothetical protein